MLVEMLTEGLCELCELTKYDGVQQHHPKTVQHIPFSIFEVGRVGQSDCRSNRILGNFINRQS